MYKNSIFKDTVSPLNCFSNYSVFEIPYVILRTTTSMVSIPPVRQEVCSNLLWLTSVQFWRIFNLFNHGNVFFSATSISACLDFVSMRWLYTWLQYVQCKNIRSDLLLQ
ncbi:hypothetical protein FKM82_026132 [Ascaphus truei]